VPFVAKFETASDFYDRFDYGYSGQNPFDWPAGEAILSFHGDHDMKCGGPTTDRTVAFGGDREHLDYSQLFWYCAPGGDVTKGHIMTGVDTVSYNIAWFSPKPYFSGISQVCWDVNETQQSRRKWIQVLFVSEADATRYPVGSAGPPTRSSVGQTRGSGGFDLGYTSPEFRDPKGVGTGLFPQGGTLAGFKSEGGNAQWFQNQDTWTTQDMFSKIVPPVTDKAARYQHCLSNQPGNIVRLTQQTPSGTRTIDMQGQIPQTAVRVVFQDDNYNPPKDAPPENPDGTYNSNVITWHWDNIQVDAASASTPPPAPQPLTAPQVSAAHTSAEQSPAVVSTQTSAVVGPVAGNKATDAIVGLAVAGLSTIVLLGFAWVVAGARNFVTRERSTGAE